MPAGPLLSVSTSRPAVIAEQGVTPEENLENSGTRETQIRGTREGRPETRWCLGVVVDSYVYIVKGVIGMGL